jgi:glycosyltransferase involved in cell wall biosynthesis
MNDSQSLHPKKASQHQEKMLSIVIPALNEEAAIADTLTRCLAARDSIINLAGLSGVEIIVVSDGSTDRTVEIARGFAEVRVIEFKINQGYGAAIKEGWRQARGSLLAFIDADGTCDPENFAEMSRISLEESADVVLGSRLGPTSKMPTIRRIGNRIYAFLLGLLCGRHVTDTASGMRVVKRQSLKYLYPLPNGLHFTPSMSARALLNDLRVIEIPMSYEERIGESKLSVIRDGIGFLKTIFAGVLCYRPENLLLIAFAFCAGLMVLLAAYPVEFYFQNGRLEEWMLYRFTACYLLGSVALLLLLMTGLTNQLAQFGPRRKSAAPFWSTLIRSLLRGWPLLMVLNILILMAIFFLWPGLVQYFTTGHTNLHWSRLLAGAFSLFSAVQTTAFALLSQVIAIWAESHEAISSVQEATSSEDKRLTF